MSDAYFNALATAIKEFRSIDETSAEYKMELRRAIVSLARLVNELVPIDVLELRLPKKPRRRKLHVEP